MIAAEHFAYQGQAATSQRAKRKANDLGGWGRCAEFSTWTVGPRLQAGKASRLKLDQLM